MQDIPKAYAVREVPLRRFEACKGPLSPTWTLYDSSELLKDLQAYTQGPFTLDQKTLDDLLERNGFNKAVRVRMEVLAWKERLRIEEQNLKKVEAELRENLRKLQLRIAAVQEQLISCRNILRIPRENRVLED